MIAKLILSDLVVMVFCMTIITITSIDLIKNTESPLCIVTFFIVVLLGVLSFIALPVLFIMGIWS